MILGPCPPPGWQRLGHYRYAEMLIVLLLEKVVEPAVFWPLAFDPLDPAPP